MPRQTKPTEQPLPEQTLVVDNGAFTIKAGFVKSEPQLEDCLLVPNCLARDREKRVWVGSQLNKCQDFGEIAFRRPVEKGYLVNWEAERAIWNSVFFDKGAALKCEPHETNLVLTEAPNAPATLQSNCDQIIFEEFEFASYSRCLGSSLNAYHDIPHLFGAPARSLPQSDGPACRPAECLLLIDSGFSHTTVTPLFKGRPIQRAIRRLDIGGKFLTNYLKELVSIRHYNMSDETYLINEIKETVCYVSNDFKHDLEVTWKGAPANREKVTSDGREIVVDYVLPDYNANKHGFMRPHDPSLTAKMRKLGALAGAGGPTEDFMTLGNERFAVPELLFRPGDTGMKQAGLPEIVLQSLSGLPPGLWPAMLASILVVGGNSYLDGFMERLEVEVRQLAPAECTVRIARATDPIRSTWLGGAYMAADRSKLKSVQVTRQEYQEHGGAWLAKVFSGAHEK
ncbi:Actin- protein 6 [Pseudocyphellaria aurata]|nr:Actin- protein 6 [Pseudocyphellaria aurata]